MKSTKYLVYFLLFAFVLGSCTEEVGYEKGEARPYVRIPNRDLVIETDKDNAITVTPEFDSDQTAAGKYKWSVANQELASLVENGDNSVIITGLKPGKTYLKVESENGKLQYTSTLQINQSFQFNYPIFMDFGTIESPNPFNNLLSSSSGKLQGLTDIKGFTSKYEIEVNGSFLTLDRSTHFNTLGFPDNVAFDMFFNDGINIASAGFTLSKLKANIKYTLIFYATIADNNVTQTEYIVKGNTEEKVLLYTSNNQSNVATVKNILPDNDGKIKITLGPGPDNTQWAKFYGITAMIIVPEDYNLTFPLSF